MIHDKVINNPDDFDFSVARIAEATIDSPCKSTSFIDETERIAFASDPTVNQKLLEEHGTIPAFIKAGPRKKNRPQPQLDQGGNCHLRRTLPGFK